MTKLRNGGFTITVIARANFIQKRGEAYLKNIGGAAADISICLF